MTTGQQTFCLKVRQAWWEPGPSATISQPGDIFGPEAEGWHVTGAGDFDGNGSADVLLENSSSGAVGTWLLDGGAVQSFAFMSIEAPGWRVAGVGDYDGNGTSDVLLEDPATGQVGAWLMNNAAPTWLSISTEAPGWRAAHT